MRIVLTGGGTGGHFYPLLAVVEHMEDIVEAKRLVSPEFFYIGPPAFDAAGLVEHDIVYVHSPAGKARRYRSILNVFDLFVTFAGIIKSVFLLFSIYPDVIFSTGGYAAFPTLCAARILNIPTVIYDADAKPGRVTLWSSKFAKWIAVAQAEAVAAYPSKLRSRVAIIGHPIRKEIESPTKEGGFEFLKLGPRPTIFIIGGSQGSRSINDVVLNALPDLLSRYNIVHQTGRANIDELRGIASVILKDSPFKERYRIFGLLNSLALRMTAGVSSLVIARSGSGTIFEIAAWKLPSILVPLPIDVSHDQTENAFSYARAGAAVVVDQRNLTPHLLSAEIDRIMNDDTLRRKMSASAAEYARPDAGKKLSAIILETALAHEPV